MTVVARLTRVRSSRLVQGSAWILVGLAIQSALGFAFWLLGARVASDAELGRAAALYTAIQFVNYASGLGLTVALARHATGTDPEADSLFTWGAAATLASSIAGGSIFLLASHTSSVELVKGNPIDWLIFCGYTAGTSIGLLVDVRLMAARRWGWLVARIAVTGLVRLPLVGIDAGVDADRWLYHLMLAPMALTGVAALALLPRLDAGRLRRARPLTLAPVARYAGVNWVATLASQAPQFVLPLLVVWSVSDATNANFFLAWTVTGLVLLVPGAIAQVLLVEGSKDEVAAGGDGLPASAPTSVRGGALAPAARARAREALAFSLAIAVAAYAGSLVAEGLVTAVFGDAYERTAALLPSLVVAGIPWAFTSVRLTEARIRRDQVATVAITGTLGLGILLPALLWVPAQGTDGATRAWLLGNVAAAVVALVFRSRPLRAVRPAG